MSQHHGQTDRTLRREMNLTWDGLLAPETDLPPTPPALAPTALAPDLATVCASLPTKDGTGGHPRPRIAAARRKFLLEYAKTGLLTVAAEAAGIHRNTAFQWAKEPEFGVLMQEAKMRAIEQAELALRTRGVEGYTKGVWHQGVRVGEERQYSDLAAIAYLRAHAPERYARMERVEHTGPGGGPIQHVHIDAVRAVLASRQQTLATNQPAAQLPAPAGEDAANLPSSTIDSDT